MAEAGLLERLSLNKWYKYLLYLAGVTLVIGIYFQMQYASTNPSAALPDGIAKGIGFATSTIILGILLWLIDDILDEIWNYYNYLSKKHSHNYDNEATILISVKYIIWVIAFIIWALFIA